MANLGAVCWGSCKAGLYEQWASSMKGEESAKAEAWRSEGRLAAMESLKPRIADISKIQEQLQLSESAREAERLRAEQRLNYETERLRKELADVQLMYSQSIESEVAHRLTDVVRKVEERKDQEASTLRLKIAALTEDVQTAVFMESSRAKRVSALEQELAKAESEFALRVEEAKKFHVQSVESQKSNEISDLRHRIAELSSVSEILAIKEEARSLLAEKVHRLEEEAEKKQVVIDKLMAENTKSSYAIGKEGESQIFNVIRDYVLPVFLYASAKDMTGVSHAADIHLYLQSPLGKRMKILIDAKKYKESVRTKEVTKLHSDVDDDDEAMSGMMISTSSQISSVKQFQIEKTPKGKYILYLSVEGFDDELRGRAICWAVRVLSTLVSYSDDSDVNILGKIAEFFKELDLSLKEADQLVKSCQKALDLSAAMKKNLGKRMDDFRVEHLGGVVIQDEESPVKSPRTRGQKKKVAAEIITHDTGETETLTPMQRYYQANREKILAKKKESRNKKKHETPAD